jgi:hypothetical protein
VNLWTRQVLQVLGTLYIRFLVKIQFSLRFKLVSEEFAAKPRLGFKR